MPHQEQQKTRKRARSHDNIRRNKKMYYKKFEGIKHPAAMESVGDSIKPTGQ
jgi:hypothetical protein